jgi:hypothetical protein
MEVHPYVAKVLDSECDRVLRASAGQGNNELNRAAFVLGTWVGGGGLDEDFAHESLTDAATQRGHMPQLEIANTIRSGLSAGQGKPRTIPEKAADFKAVTMHRAPRLRDVKEFPVDHDAILEKTKAAAEVNEHFLARRSPIDVRQLMHDEAGRYATFLNALFPEDARILVQNTYRVKAQYLWTKSELHRISEKPNTLGSHLCPTFPEPGDDGLFFAFNPVVGRWVANGIFEGQTRYSRRCIKSIADFRYMLLESDIMPIDDWLRVLSQFPLPVASIVSTGGRSAHALIRVDASGVIEWKKCGETIIKAMSHVGLDPAPCKNPCEFSRMPGAWRKSKGDRQRLLYLNPKPECRPLVNLQEVTQ